MGYRPRTALPPARDGTLPFGEPPTRPPERDVYTVSRLNRTVKDLLEAGLPLIVLEAEISNLVQHGSGHWYFSLKDEAAQVRCAMFRAANQRVRTPIRAGMQVRVRARVGLYEPRGEFQLVVEQMEEAGEGALRRRFEELKALLAAEGLFDTARKRPLPRLPRRIGVITSPTGAAVRDILKVLARRFPAVPVLIYPASVQGATAAAELVAALDLATSRAEVDVLIVARGGGAIEDLMAFNDETLARRIAASSIPVISGVGHEIDFTIADFVADVRAPTPSGAAELAVPDRGEWQRALRGGALRLLESVARHLARGREGLTGLERRLERQHPGLRLTARAQRLDELHARLAHAAGESLRRRQRALTGLARTLELASPRQALVARGQAVESLRQRLAVAVRRRQERDRARLDLAGRALSTVSPLATLGRGYAIVRTAGGALARSGNDAPVGSKIEAMLADGVLEAVVTATRRSGSGHAGD